MNWPLWGPICLRESICLFLNIHITRFALYLPHRSWSLLIGLRQKAYISETIHTYGGEVIGPIAARSEEDENLFSDLLWANQLKCYWPYFRLGRSGQTKQFFLPKYRNRNKALAESRNRNFGRYTFSAETVCFGRKTSFRPKETVSAIVLLTEMCCLSRLIRPKLGISATALIYSPSYISDRHWSLFFGSFAHFPEVFRHN